MKILLTGGAGFIGSHLADRLVGRGDEVWCVDNFVTGSKKNIEQLSGKDSFHLIEADVSESVGSYLKEKIQVEQIFHLASPASPKGYQSDPVGTYKVNAFGTHYLAEFALELGARMLFASTSEVYGDPLEHPQKEGYLGNVNIRGPRACYDVSKRFGEMVQTVWNREKKLDIRTVRIFNTYGPRMDPDDGRVIPNFVSQALKGESITVYGDGGQTRSFCYVDDLVDGLIKVMDSSDTAGEVYNLGSPDERTMIDLANLIKEVTTSKSEVVFKDLPEDDPTKRKPDIEKVKNKVGWAPVTEFKTGLGKTIDYFKSELRVS